MKAPPPLAQATPGNLKKLPRPTALPVTARITPSFDPHFSFAITFLPKKLFKSY